MATNAATSTGDKIKLLDQMLEDLAGDEFEIDNDPSIESDYKRYGGDSQFSTIDNIH